RFEVRLRTVVIDAQAAADVEVARLGPDSRQLHENPGRLRQGAFDVANVSDLASQVEMDQLEAIGQLAFLQVIKGLKHFRQGQTEFGAEPGAVLPPPRSPRRQFDPHSDQRLDVQLLRIADDRLQLAEFFDDRNDLLADLASQDGHLDEFVVFEAVADDRHLQPVGLSQDHQQLGFRSRLQAEVERTPEIEKLFDHVPLLVHFDRVNAAVRAFVVVLLNGQTKCLVDFADTMAEDVGEAKEDRQLNAAGLKLVDKLLQVDSLLGILGGVNRDVAGGVDAEVAFAPVLNPVILNR